MNESYPVAFDVARPPVFQRALVFLRHSMWRFLLGLVRWEANVLAHLASLVDRYPPFALETGSLSAAASSS